MPIRAAEMIGEMINGHDDIRGIHDVIQKIVGEEERKEIVSAW
jgi:hypothetical protein